MSERDRKRKLLGPQVPADVARFRKQTRAFLDSVPPPKKQPEDEVAPAWKDTYNPEEKLGSIAQLEARATPIPAVAKPELKGPSIGEKVRDFFIKPAGAYSWDPGSAWQESQESLESVGGQIVDALTKAAVPQHAARLEARATADEESLINQPDDRTYKFGKPFDFESKALKTQEPAVVKPKEVTPPTPAEEAEAVYGAFKPTVRLPDAAEAKATGAAVIPRLEDEKGNFMEAPARNYGEDLPLEDYATEILRKQGQLPEGANRMARLTEAQWDAPASASGLNLRAMATGNKNIAEGRMGQGSYTELPNESVMARMGFTTPAEQEAALIKKWLSFPPDQRGPRPGSPEEAARMNPEVFSIGDTGGYGMFGNEYRDRRNAEMAARNAAAGIQGFSKDKGYTRASPKTQAGFIAERMGKYDEAQAQKRRLAAAPEIARIDAAGRRPADRPSQLEVARLRSQLTEGRDVAAAERAEGAKVRAEDRAASRAEEAAFLKGIELYPEMQGSYYKLRGASSPERAMQIIREAQVGAVKGEGPEDIAARIEQIAARKGVML